MQLTKTYIVLLLLISFTSSQQSISISSFVDAAVGSAASTIKSVDLQSTFESSVQSAKDNIAQYTPSTQETQEFIDSTSSFGRQSLEKIETKIKDTSSQISSKTKELVETTDWDQVKEIAIYAAIFVFAVILVALCIKFLGFTVAGVAAGSIAALIQGLIGLVKTGSGFACCQSCGATQYLLQPKVLLVAAALGIGFYFIMKLAQ